MYLATGPYGKIIAMAPVSLIVVGAGQRGTGYARWARRHLERATVVAGAEPRPAPRSSPRPPTPPRPAAPASPPSTAYHLRTRSPTGRSWPAAAGWPTRS